MLTKRLATFTNEESPTCKDEKKMSKITIIVPVHNEEKLIATCLDSLLGLDPPDKMIVEYLVLLDRCTDRTKEIVQSMGVPMMEKNFFRGDFATPLNEAVDYAINHTDGDLILLCDADIQEVPRDAIIKLLPHLTDEVRRISAGIRTRAEKWWVNILFLAKEVNSKINPLGREPHGAFQLFKRETYEKVGGVDPTKGSFDTNFDLRIKARGWKVKIVTDVVVTQKRDYQVKDLIKNQIETGRARKQLGISFIRTLLHSVFRGRFFVMCGYLKEAWS